jgi:hypothetical protein
MKNVYTKNILYVLYILIIIIAILFHIWNEVLLNLKKVTRTIRDCKPIHQNYKPQTGDLIFTQYKSHGISQYVAGKGCPTHAAIVWIKHNEVFVIENTLINDNVFDHFYGKERLTHPNGGVRVIKLSEFISKIDGFCSVRPIMKGKLNVNKIENILETWGFLIQFDIKMSFDMALATHFAFASRPLFRNLSNILFYDLKNHRKQIASQHVQFCSEFIVQFLQKLGHVSEKFKDYWKITPFCLTSQVGIIDDLSKNSKHPIIWGEDQVLLCP